MTKNLVVQGKAFGSRQSLKSQALTLLDALQHVRPRVFSANQMDWSLSSKETVEETVRAFKILGYTGTRELMGFTIDPKLKTSTVMTARGDYPVVLREPVSGFGTQIILIGESLPRFPKVLALLKPILTTDTPVVTILPPTTGVASLAVVCRRFPVDDIEMQDLLGSDFKTFDGGWRSRKYEVIVRLTSENTLAVIDN